MQKRTLLYKKGLPGYLDQPERSGQLAVEVLSAETRVLSGSESGGGDGG